MLHQINVITCGCLNVWAWNGAIHYRWTWVRFRRNNLTQYVTLHSIHVKKFTLMKSIAVYNRTINKHYLNSSEAHQSSRKRAHNFPIYILQFVYMITKIVAFFSSTHYFLSHESVKMVLPTNGLAFALIHRCWALSYTVTIFISHLFTLRSPKQTAKKIHT